MSKKLKESEDSSSTHSRFSDKKKVKDKDGNQQRGGEDVQKMLDIEDQGYQVGDSRTGDSKWTLKQILQNMLDEIKKSRRK